MKIIDNFRSMNHKQKQALKMKARLVYSNILFQAVCMGAFLYLVLFLFEQIG